MKAILRSVVPAVLVLGVVAAGAVWVTRVTAEPPAAPGTWVPPPGFAAAVTLFTADDTSVALWLGREGPPKPSDCWYLVHTDADGYLAVGGCGGEPGQPWIVRQAGVVAGGTGEDAARWVRIGGGSPIPVTRGHFLDFQQPSAPTTSVELLDDTQSSLAYFPEVPVGGAGG